MAATDWSEKTRMLVTISIGVGANLALAVLFYFAYSSHAEKTAELNKQKTVKKGLEERVKTLTKLTDDLTKLETKFETDRKKLPDAQAVDKLYGEISPMIVKNHGVNKSFSIRPNTEATPNQNLLKTTISTRWEGSFFCWLNTINEMEEHYNRFVGIENLTLSPRNAGVVITGMPMDISCDIVTYLYKAGP